MRARPQPGKRSSPFSAYAALDGRSPQRAGYSAVHTAEERRATGEARDEYREGDRAAAAGSTARPACGIAWQVASGDRAAVESGEDGNLGFTERAEIERVLAGGKINTDAGDPGARIRAAASGRLAKIESVMSVSRTSNEVANVPGASRHIPNRDPPNRRSL